MSNCRVAPPRSTRIPMAAPTRKSGTIMPPVVKKRVNIQSGMPSFRKSIHSVIEVEPLNSDLKLGRRLSSSAVSEKIDFSKENSFLCQIETTDGRTETGIFRRNSFADVCTRRHSDDGVTSNDDNTSAGSLAGSEDYHETEQSSFQSSSPSSLSSSPISTSSSSVPEKQTLGNRQVKESRIPCPVEQGKRHSYTSEYPIKSLDTSTDKLKISDSSKEKPIKMQDSSSEQCKLSNGLNKQILTDKQNKIGIYTDWANHYLEKAGHKRRIADLQNDIVDGVLLADVIESVTGEKIKEIKPKPKNSAQMVENINTCLTSLAGLGVSVDGISAKDIKDGNLKSILGLFFSLSRHKQQQKTLQQQHKQQQQQQHRLSGEHQQIQQRGQGSSSSCAAGDNISVSGGSLRSRGQSNSGEDNSRNPSPLKQGGKNSSAPLSSSTPLSASSSPSCSTFKDNSSGSNNNSSSNVIPRNNSSKSSLPTERGRLHQNQQHPTASTCSNSTNTSAAGSAGNNATGYTQSQACPAGSSSLIPLRSSNSNSGGTPRATSPGASHSSIPTPIGRGIPNSRSQTLTDKQSNRTSAGSSSSTSSTKSNTSSKPPSSNKNSMLDKFKFFKDKDKEKDKEKSKCVVKSSSKNSSTSTSTTSNSSRSDTDSRTSDTAKSSSFTSSQSSSSGDHAGPSCLGATAGSGPSCLGTTAGGGPSCLGATASTQSSPSKNSSKTGKKSLVKAFSSIKDVPEDTGRSGAPPPIPSAVGLGPPTGGPYALSPSSSSSSSQSQRNTSPNQCRKTSTKSDRSDPRQGDPRLATVSPTPSSSKKTSKIGSLTGIPKTQPSVSPSGKSSKTSSAATTIPTSSSSCSIPALSSSGIPKPSSSKSSVKTSKEEKTRTAAANKEYNQALYKDLPGMNAPKSLASSTKLSSTSSPSSPHHQQQQLQQQSSQQQAYNIRQQQQQNYSQQAYSSPQLYPQHYPPSQGSPTVHSQQTYNTPYGYIPPYAHNPGYATPTRVAVVQNVHPRVNLQSVERQQQLSSDQASAFAPGQQRATTMASHYVPVTIPAVNMDTHPSNLSQTGRTIKQMLPQSPMMSPNLGRHNPSVNVVKPTMSSATPSTSNQKSNKSDSNTQTSLSVLHKSVAPRHISSALESGNKPDDASSQTDPTSMSAASPSLTKSFRGKSATPERMMDSSDTDRKDTGKGSTPSIDGNKLSMKENILVEMAEFGGRTTPLSGSIKDVANLAMEKALMSSNVNSPKLGVKMLGSHISKTACNVAVVQPRSGDKVETTFDAEVRTETIHKLNADTDTKKGPCGKETTFQTAEKDEKTLFMDDAGETMDIKPMPPIMRALPYGYFRGYSGYGGFNNRNFHIPGISVPTTAMYASRTTSAHGLGLPRPYIEQSSVKYYSGQIKRTSSNTCPNNTSSETDYTSESETYDYVSGYMSDGDILKNRNNGGGDDWTSGYLSEGGASLYARRLQQRFREGMQAVRECMQKSGGIIDDDSFDDSSSISSGEISDTIAEISTDENLTGSSQGALSDNPYNSLKRAPKDIQAMQGVFHNGAGGPAGFPFPHPGLVGKRVPNLGTSAFMGTDYNSDSGLGASSPWGRKYSLPQAGKFLSTDANKLLSSDPSDYGYGYGWPSSRSDGGYSSLRKMSNASNPDYAYHSEGDYDSPHSPYTNNPGMKKDTETNTEQSHLMEASLRRLQTARVSSSTPPSSNGVGTQFGYRRPLSNASNSSGGSNKSSGSKTQNYGSSTVGSRLAKHGVDSEQRTMVDVMIQRPASASGKPTNPDIAFMEGFTSSTLDRKKKNVGLTSSKSTGCTQTDYQSNSLGRRQLFGSKSNLSKSMQADQSGSASSLVGTIICNPHATFGRDKQTSHYVNLQELQARIPGSNYVPLEFASSPRNSAIGSQVPGIHGSTLSLVSSSSSVYSATEDKHAHEVRKLRRDLLIAQEKVQTLTKQLCTNAHVVSAFEQSLTNMTARLQSLTTNTEHKTSLPNTELNELRMTIEALKRQSKMTPNEPVMSPSSARRHTSPGMKDIHINATDPRIARQMSSDSVSSINSLSSACSMTSQQSAHTDSEANKRLAKETKKKGWLRSSFSKAFSRKKGKTGSLSDVEPDSHSLRSNVSAPNSPLLQLGHIGTLSMKGSHSSGALCDNDVNALKQALRDKDMKLTDIRLEALSSAHQLEQLRETMTKMKNEMSALKADNDRLHKMMSTSQSSRTLNLSHGPMSPHHKRTSTDSLDRSFSMTDHSSLDMLLAETAANERDGKRVTISVVLGSNPDLSRTSLDKPGEILIGSLSVSGKTKWDMLDNVIRKLFKEYVLRVDPVTNLGLSAESVYSYVVGEVARTKESDLPELLPIGYLVGDTTQIEICLKGTKQSCVDSLAFETMIPKTIIQRYVSLLLEHRRIILCGPSGTGKTYLGQKLAEHVVLRSGRELTAGSVATFNVDHKSAKELRQYLANIADQCENTNMNALPSAIILDNLHLVTSLADVFNGFLSVKFQKCPYIIGTMSQSSCSTTNLQLHHNFRFVLCANHMEVKGFLGRFLRRKLVETEIRTGIRNNDLNRVVDWIPKVWAHLNKALESHSSADVTIGPRLFMSCPMDIAGSQVWFTDLWNYTLVETVREGLQVYGCRSAWEDPTEWVLETYPWPSRGSGTSLLHIRADDLGYEPTQVSSPTSLSAKTKSPVADSKENDPLVNMLMRLQEAAGTYNNSLSKSVHESIDTHSNIQDFNSSTGMESRL